MSAFSLFLSQVMERALGILSRLLHSLAEARKSRERLEAELFRNRYHISSKNDDDLPIVR
jgi:hypothetical protein